MAKVVDPDRQLIECLHGEFPEEYVKEAAATIERLLEECATKEGAINLMGTRIEELGEEAGYWKDKALGMAARFEEIGSDDES